MKCMYCGDQVSSAWRVKQAIKPKHARNRWKYIGYCCDDCDAAGKQTSIEYKETKEVIKAQK